MNDNRGSDTRGRSSVLIFGVLVACFFALYLHDTSRTVCLSHDDAAEFQTVGAVGGIPHQPYPLWCVLARVAAQIPVGESAFRVALLSTILAAFAVGLVFLLTLEITGDRAAAAVAAAAFGVVDPFWRNACIAEVHALNTFLLALVLLLMIKWRAKHSGTAWYLMLMAVGLLLSNHQLNVGMLPALVYLLFSERKHLAASLSASRLALSVLVFLTPFTLYIYTYIVDRDPQVLNWHKTQGIYLYRKLGYDADGYGRFLEKLRFQFSTERFGSYLHSPQTMITRVLRWCSKLVTCMYPVAGTFVIGWGVVSFWRTNRKDLLFWLVLIVPYWLLALSQPYGGMIIHEYSIPVYLALSVFLAKGFVSITRSVRLRGRSRGLVAASIAAACIVFPVLRHAEGFPLAEEALKVKGAQAPRWFTHVYSRNDGGDLYAKSVEEVVPSGSALFGSWEGINVLRYHQLVKDGLAGVQLYYSYTPWLIKELIDSTNPDRVYFTFAPEDPEFEVVDVIDVGTTGDKLYLIDCKSNRADSTGGSQSEKDTSR